MPNAYLQSTLRHPVGPGAYVTLAWMATSLATVVGALGASLEHEDTVREATYGYRQRRRQNANDSEDQPEGDAVGVEGFATHRLPLDDASHGYEIFQKKQDDAIKVLLKPSHPTTNPA